MFYNKYYKKSEKEARVKVLAGFRRREPDGRGMRSRSRITGGEEEEEEVEEEEEEDGEGRRRRKKKKKRFEM